MHRFFLASIFIVFSFIAKSQQFWRSTSAKPSLRSEDNRNVSPSEYKVYQLDYKGLSDYLHRLSNVNQREGSLIISIPDELGNQEDFSIWEMPVLEPELAQKYPNIKSYKGISTSNKAKAIWFTTSIQGFYAVILDGDKEVYIDPYSLEDNENYIVYNTKYNTNSSQLTTCGVEDFSELRPTESANRSLAGQVEMRIYRIAVACTGEWGSVARRGTVEKCLADINTMLTRMNSIYESEMAVRFKLIADNEKVIYLDPNTDPYTNSDEGKKILGGNTAVLTNALGSASGFEVGHVLSICYDIGGVAQLGSLCRSNKGNGVTCNNNNDLSNIVTRVMAHEVGHQFSASHTWNRCSAYTDQRASGTAVEPGSGTTIMSYAGSCSSDNVAGDNDAYFHAISLEQMTSYTTNNVPAHQCAEKIELTNHFPKVSVPTNDYVIPNSTPFYLAGTATDEDGDNLTYCWEQIDIGPETELGTNNNLTGPMFRSVKPSSDGIRFIPTINNIITGVDSKNEPLPVVTRDFKFRLTIRDNNPLGGGISWADYSVSTTDQAGPFIVTYPQSSLNLKYGDKINVKWNVANTDKSPIDVSHVNIYGSINSALKDGDPNLILLASSVPNDGSEDVIIPNVESRFFRIVVKAIDNIFLNVSNAASRVDPPTAPTLYYDLSRNNIQLCQPYSEDIDLTTAGYGGLTDPIKFEVDGLPNGVTAELSSQSTVPGESLSIHFNTENLVTTSSGQIIVRGIVPGVDTLERIIYARFVSGKLDNIQPIAPNQGFSGETTLPTFKWNDLNDASTYEIQVSLDPSFSTSSLTFSKITSDTTVKSSEILEKATVYFWRLRALNECKEGPWSKVHAFSTEAQSCSIIQSGSNEINITSTGTPSVELGLNVEIDGSVNDLNIPEIVIKHSRVSDLVVSLVAPSGKTNVLWSKKCPTGLNVKVGLDDQSPKFFGCPINTGNIYKPDIPLANFNGENAKGNWILKVDDTQSGAGGQLISFDLEICSNLVLDQPYVVTNKPLEMYPTDRRDITKDLLLLADNNNTDEQIIFTIVANPVHGQLYLGGTLITVGNTFSQKDINDLKLVYQSMDSFEGEDSFEFIATDGQGGWVPITSFVFNRNTSFPSGTHDEWQKSAMYLYPNPVKDMLNVSIIELTDGWISVYNTNGQLVYKTSIRSKDVMISTENWIEGIYSLQLSSNGQIATKKFVKLK